MSFVWCWALSLGYVNMLLTEINMLPTEPHPWRLIFFFLNNRRALLAPEESATLVHASCGESESVPGPLSDALDTEQGCRNEEKHSHGIFSGVRRCRQDTERVNNISKTHSRPRGGEKWFYISTGL